MTNPADLFFGDSSKSAKFETVGETVGGPITHIGEARQQTEFGSGKPLTWDDGSPRMQLPVTVQTTLRDAADPNDDGQRTFYVKGEMKKAIGQALRAAGAKMAVGGVLTISYVGEEPTKGFPKKLYAATYAPPAPGAGFFEEAAQPVQPAPVYQQPTVQPVQQAQPAPQPQAAPAAQPGMVQLTAEQYAAMQAAMAAQQQPAPAQQPTPTAPYSQYAEAMGFLPPKTDTPPF